MAQFVPVHSAWTEFSLAQLARAPATPSQAATWAWKVAWRSSPPGQIWVQLICAVRWRSTAARALRPNKNGDGAAPPKTLAHSSLSASLSSLSHAEPASAVAATVAVDADEEDSHRTKSGSPSSSSFLFPFPFASSAPQSERTTMRRQPVAAVAKEGSGAAMGPLAGVRAHPKLSASPSSGLAVVP